MSGSYIETDGAWRQGEALFTFFLLFLLLRVGIPRNAWASLTSISALFFCLVLSRAIYFSVGLERVTSD
jgi:hypothetical protein